MQRWFAFDAATGRQRDGLEVAQPFCQFALYGLRVNVSRNQDDGIVRGIPFVVESAELSGFRRTDGGFAADGRITAVARALQQRGVALQCQAVFSVLTVPPFVEDGFLLDLPVGRLELARPQDFGSYGQAVFQFAVAARGEEEIAGIVVCGLGIKMAPHLPALSTQLCGDSLRIGRAAAEIHVLDHVRHAFFAVFFVCRAHFHL